MGRVNPAVIFARGETKLGFERVVATFFFFTVQFTVTPFLIVFRLIMFHDRDGAQGLRP